MKELDGKSIYEAYQEAVKEGFNHKIFAAMRVLKQELFEKAIVFMESVEAAKQFGAMLQQSYGMENVASEWVIFENSSHTPHLEEPERYIQVLTDFLSRVEAQA